MGHQFLKESEDEALKNNGLMRTDAPRNHKSENNTFEQSEHPRLSTWYYRLVESQFTYN